MFQSKLLRAVLVAVGLLLTTTKPAEAALQVSDSPWLNPISYRNNLEAVSVEPNKSCTWHMETMANHSLRRLCVMPTAWGKVSEDGYLQKDDDNRMLPVLLPASQKVIAVSGTDRLYVRINQPAMPKVFRVGYYGGDAIIKVANGMPGAGTAYKTIGAPTIVQYTGQTFIYGKTNYWRMDLLWQSVGFSRNGKWMAGVLSGQITTDSYYSQTTNKLEFETTIQDAYVRIDILRDSSVAFGNTSGKKPEYMTIGISNDGLITSITGGDYWKIDLYSVEEDGVYMGTIRDVRTEVGDARVLEDREAGGQYPSNAFFTEDDSSLVYNTKHGNRTDLMTLKPSQLPAAAALSSYMALGDSFSSGEGELSYRPETDFYINDVNFNLCHQSTLSYGYLFRDVLALDKFGSLACSGAASRDILFYPKSNNDNYWQNGNSQARGMPFDKHESEITQGLLPGYIDQVKLVEKIKPEVATLSVGGNDVGFASIVTACVLSKSVFFSNNPYGQYHPCYEKRDDRERLANEIDAVIPKLTETYKQLRSKMSGDARLYVVGYPESLNPDSNLPICSANAPLSPSERRFAHNAVVYLNSAVEQAAHNAGAGYVDVTNAFEDGENDYRLCGNQTSPAVNGITLKSSSKKKPGDVAKYESFHPNIKGHLLFAETIRNATDDLTAPMPKPATNPVNAVDAYLREDLVGDTEIKTTKKESHTSTITSSALYKSIKNQMSQYLRSSTAFARLFLHSEPVLLGEYPVGTDRKVEGEFTLPPDTPLGYHELHLVYTGDDGQQYDDYQIVFVAASPDDYDGDGIPNDQEVCSIGEPSGTDSDGDGIDDTCDGIVGSNYGSTRSQGDLATIMYNQEGTESADEQINAKNSMAAKRSSAQEPEPQHISKNKSPNDVSSVISRIMKDMAVAPRIPLLVQALCLIAGVVMAAGTIMYYVKTRQR